MQGFPRGDIDVPAVRADRHHIICLTNDHKKLMGQIQELMLQLHAAERCVVHACTPHPAAADPLHIAAGMSLLYVHAC
jgi:26S proteasome non-ATPase regulatory subunit 9